MDRMQFEIMVASGRLEYMIAEDFGVTVEELEAWCRETYGLIGRHWGLLKRHIMKGDIEDYIG